MLTGAHTLLGAAWKLESGVSDREVAVVFGLLKGASPGWPVVSSITSTASRGGLAVVVLGKSIWVLGRTMKRCVAARHFVIKTTMLCAVGGDQVGVIK